MMNATAAPNEDANPDEMIWNEESDESREDESRAAEEAKSERVTAIGNSVRGMIEEAVQAKESSGVETRWREDLTYYYGSEDIAKKVTGVVDLALAGSAAKGATVERQTRSTINVNITRPKVNAAFARLSDMLLPVDDRNFSIEHTPVPDIPAAVDPSQDPKRLVAGEGGTVMTAGEQRLKLTATAKAAAELMQKEIDDNLVECDYNAESRKMLFQAVCLGTGVMKGPVAANKTNSAWVKSEATGEWVEKIKTSIVPESQWCDIWNIYPDPAAGGIVRNMRYIVERDEYNTRMLRSLRDQPGYLTEHIDMCLKERPGSMRRTNSEKQIVQGSYLPKDNELYEVYIVSCELTRGDLADLGVEECCAKDGPEKDDKDECWREEARNACVVVCNGRPIKAYLSPILSGGLGYDFFSYEPVHGQAFGLGVSFLMRSPQRVVSTAWRMVMDNAAYCVGGQVVFDGDGIEPVDGTMQLYGGKMWRKTAKLSGKAVEDAFRVYNMDMHLGDLEKIIALGMKFAEDETSLPSLMEGNKGAAPDTVGGMTLLMNSANVVLKVLAKRYDDDVTKPHIGRYNEWHMRHNPKTEIKGDFRVMARGSTHLVIRDLERQSLVGFMQYAVVPTLAPFFKTGGYPALRKVAEANHINPDDVLVSEEEAPKVFAAMQQAAQAQAQAASGDKGSGAAQVAMQRLDFDREDNELQRRHELELKRMDYELKIMEFADKKQMTIEAVRADLAKVVIQNTHDEKMQNNEIVVKNEKGSGI